MVKNVKQWLTKQGGGVRFGVALSEFLRTYRNVPHSTTGRSPAQIVFGRALCTRLSFVLPCMSERVKEQLQPQEGLSVPQVFSQGAGVWIRDFCSLHVDAGYNTVISWSIVLHCQHPRWLPEKSTYRPLIEAVRFTSIPPDFTDV